jgi:hypothetical protein
MRIWPPVLNQTFDIGAHVLLPGNCPAGVPTPLAHTLFIGDILLNDKELYYAHGVALRGA